MVTLDEHDWQATLCKRRKSLRQVKKALSRLSELYIKAWWCLEKWRKFNTKAEDYEKFLVSRGYYLSYDTRNFYSRRSRHSKKDVNIGLNDYLGRKNGKG